MVDFSKVVSASELMGCAVTDSALQVFVIQCPSRHVLVLRSMVLSTSIDRSSVVCLVLRVASKAEAGQQTSSLQ